MVQYTNNIDLDRGHFKREEQSSFDVCVFNSLQLDSYTLLLTSAYVTFCQTLTFFKPLLYLLIKAGRIKPTRKTLKNLRGKLLFDCLHFLTPPLSPDQYFFFFFTLPSPLPSCVRTHTCMHSSNVKCFCICRSV